MKLLHLNYKPWIALVLAVITAFFLCLGAAAAETGTHPQYIQGFEDGGFHPDAPLTRAQTAAMLVRLLDEIQGQRKSFPDVAAGAWYAEAVGLLAGQGILTGYPDGTFQPERSVTRGEFVTLLTRVRPIPAGRADFSDVSGHWAASAIGAAASAGWINGYGESGGRVFRPDQSITRAEAVKVTNRAFGRSADLETIAKTSNTPHFRDVPADAWYFSDVLEAACGHTYQSTPTGERWLEITSEDPLRAAIQATRASQQTEQLVVVTGNRLTVWERDDNENWSLWKDVECGFGYNGMLPASTRHEGDGTTPIGAFPLTFAFGTGGNPGTALPYRQITPNAYWSSAEDETYNTWVERETPVAGEHLADYAMEYEYAIAIGFNTDPVVYGNGSAIFLHCKSPNHWYTSGCVSVETDVMKSLLLRLKPGAYILIAPDVAGLSGL